MASTPVPSWNLTPSFSLKVTVFWSSLNENDSASDFSLTHSESGPYAVIGSPTVMHHPAQAPPL